jgi:hypothetical protein
MLFVSSRPGGRGSADLWRASRDNTDDAFDTPVNLFELSSAQNEGRVVLSADGLNAFFTSDRNGGRGGPDVYVASRQRPGVAFGVPQNVAPLNSGAAELDVSLSSDDTELFFSSSRRGVNELWRSARSCSPEE